MIDTILTIAKVVVAILPFVLLCFVGRKVNIEKSRRSLQFPMPVIAVVFVIIAMFMMNSLNSWLLVLIKNIPKWIAALAGFDWMPEAVAGVLIQISKFISNLLAGLNLNFWIFFISNTVIIIAYMIIKKICLGIIKMVVKPESSLHLKIAGKFYDYFPEKDKWCLDESYVQVRSLLKVFYYTAIVLSSLLMIVCRYLYFDGIINSIFYPVFGILVVSELFFYLDGATKREYSQDILGEDENAYKTVNYSLLRKFLRSLFRDKLLSENTGVNNSLAYDVTNDEIIRNLEMSEDPKISSFANYFKALNATGFEIDHSYLNSSLDLLNGRSILFNNPFYNDLIPYAFYPMNRMLLDHKKVLVVLGRHAIEDDITQWLHRGIQAITNIPFMWKIGVLNCEKQDLDIGIVTRSDVLNINLHNANSQFLSEVGYFVVLEPSKLISTAQIGLNLIVKQCRSKEDRNIVFCLCDKNCDGLVDAMSHILMTSITEVSATRKHLGTSSYMCWEADDVYLHHRLVPNISRYLGFGTELSFAALKNQVSRTQWYGGEAFPVTDINWIDKQYYYNLMKYAGLPTSEDAMDDYFKTSPNFWSAEVMKNNYITVEDEAYNMFEILRDFSTRTTEQGFINVISSNYLLKDYMADNASIFESDAKAIPFIVPDYARTRRNTILKLILMMSTYPVKESILENELSLIGIKVYDLCSQLWYEIFNCYSSLSVLNGLSGNYEEDVKNVSRMCIEVDGNQFDISLINSEVSFDFENGNLKVLYSISDKTFLNDCVNELKSASYIAEDEKGEKYYLGSELGGHVYQKYLPGQFFTFAGKYYEMQYLTADGQILVRRAADHINGRPSYRQIRNYAINGIKASSLIGAKKDISGLKVTSVFADISVSTSGYYRMSRYNDFSSAKKVIFEGDENRIPDRLYHNKEILIIELPKQSEAFGDNVRYTITFMFNELFRTIFAENQPYICAVTDTSFITDENLVNPLTYSVTADGCEISNDCIYIIEDSQLDLGLTVAVERNLERIFSIMQDYLNWHFETLEKSLNPPAENKPPIVFEVPKEEPPKKKRNRIKEFFLKLFGRKRKKKDKKADEPKETPVQNGETDKLSSESVPAPKLNLPAPANALGTSDDKKPYEDVFKRKHYHEQYFTLFGATDEPSVLNTADTFSYLTEIGFGNNNPLKQAREGKKIAELLEQTYQPNKAGSRYCDFCGTEIYGVEYETLADGRDRCISCSRTAVKTGEEFRRIFEDVKRNMESFFGIKINTGIRVEMVNSKTLHRRLGKAFIPTPKTDGRVLGVAISDKNGYSLYVENGSPRMASMLTMAHELTHIWQYLNWNDKAIKKKYGKKMRLEIYEGMAKWAEIQYAYLINESATAKREELITSYRNDEYGRGFLRYLANYPFSTGTCITKPTPFQNIETPLAAEFCGPISIRLPVPNIPYIPDNGDDKEGTYTPEEPYKPEPIQGKKERTPNDVRLYAYELLNEAEKNVYNIIFEAIKAFSPEVSQFSESFTNDQILRIVDYIQKDHPELFWFNSGATVFFDADSKIVKRIELKYCLTKDEAAKRQSKIDVSLKPFISSITDSMSDYEVALRIYGNIIDLVDYDTLELEKQKKSSTSNDEPDDLRSIYGVFVNKKAVCAGYSKAMQYLLNYFGIECAYVTSSSHAWNLIKLEGDYYYIDATWGDQSNTKREKNQSDEIAYDYFCITTDELKRLDSHQPDADFPLPECKAVKCNYHRRHGLYFEAYNEQHIREVICKSIRSGQLCVSLKFSDSGVFNESKNKLIDENKISEFIGYSNRKEKIQVSTAYKYSLNESMFILTVTFVKN